MSGKESYRRRNSLTGTDRARARRRLWWRVYRERIDCGLERCRHCGTREGLTFDHIVPWGDGGRLKFANATILCGPCNRLKGADTCSCLSLFHEEAGRPLDQQWVRLARLRLAEEAAYAEAARRAMDGSGSVIRN